MRKTLTEHQLFLKKLKKDQFIIISGRILIFVLLLAFWELFTRIGVMDPFITSSPSRIFSTLIDLFKEGNILRHCCFYNFNGNWTCCCNNTLLIRTSPKNYRTLFNCIKQLAKNCPWSTNYCVGWSRHKSDNLNGISNLHRYYHCFIA